MARGVEVGVECRVTRRTFTRLCVQFRFLVSLVSPLIWPTLLSSPAVFHQVLTLNDLSCHRPEDILVTTEKRSPPQSNQNVPFQWSVNWWRDPVRHVRWGGNGEKVFPWRFSLYGYDWKPPNKSRNPFAIFERFFFPSEAVALTRFLLTYLGFSATLSIMEMQLLRACVPFWEAALKNYTSVKRVSNHHVVKTCCFLTGCITYCTIIVRNLPNLALIDQLLKKQTKSYRRCIFN